jgi:hypothetical protein
MADWRLEHLELQPHLRDLSFRKKPYREYRPGWDHDHCVACGAKLAEFESPTEVILHEGFATTEDMPRGADYYWACSECFQLFKAEMNWSEIS